MEITKQARAGSVESCDCLVTVSPCGEGIQLRIDSIVFNQFGEAIRQTVLSTLESLSVKNAFVSVIDRGALDYVIRARVEAAVRRASEEGTR